MDITAPREGQGGVVQDSLKHMFESGRIAWCYAAACLPCYAALGQALVVKMANKAVMCPACRLTPICIVCSCLSAESSANRHAHLHLLRDRGLHGKMLPLLMLYHVTLFARTLALASLPPHAQPLLAWPCLNRLGSLIVLPSPRRCKSDVFTSFFQHGKPKIELSACSSPALHSLPAGA